MNPQEIATRPFQMVCQELSAKLFPSIPHAAFFEPEGWADVGSIMRRMIHLGYEPSLDYDHSEIQGRPGTWMVYFFPKDSDIGGSWGDVSIVEAVVRAALMAMVNQEGSTV